jgi:hypothetical protein
MHITAHIIIHILLEIWSSHAGEYEDTSFRDTAPCSLVGGERRFRDVYWLHHQGDRRDGGQVLTSETSVYFNKTTLCYIPEGCLIQDESPHPQIFFFKLYFNITTCLWLPTPRRLIHEVLD